MSFSVYCAFLLACIVVMIVPGPAVTVVLANGLRHGRRAGLLNVAGIQRAGIALSRRRVRLMTRASGVTLIGGGLWLALSRAK